MNEARKVCFASVISEIKQSPIFLTVKARLFETPRANLNGARVTPAFLNEIIENQEKYVGLNLNADVKALVNGQYDRLGHLYDARTGEFHSTQIGSFYKFEKEDFDEGSYLVGYARISKQKKSICKAIGELFASGALKFSFEITCGSYEELDDGTIRIDAAEENFLEGMAVVSFPACEDATALEMVAELTDANGRGDTKMTDVKDTVTEVAEKIKAEEEAACEDKKQCSEEENACNNEKQVSEETASKQENATVYVTENHEERQAVYTYDDETGVSTDTVVTVDQSVSYRKEDNVFAEEAVVAEADGDTESDSDSESETEPEPEADPAEGANTDATENKKTAEQLIAEQNDAIDKQKAMIAELMEIVKTLQSEISELKEAHKEVAAVKKDNSTMNPFLAEINTNGNGYELLKSSKNESSTYSLLGKAY